MQTLTKIPLEKCLSEYSDKELIKLHAQLNMLVILCNEDLGLFTIVMRLHFVLKLRETPVTIDYLKSIEDIHNLPDKYK